MGNFTGFQKSQDYYQHPKLGLIKRIQTQDGPQLIEHKVIVESQEVVQQWKTYLESLQHSSLREVLFLPQNYYFQRVGYCGRNGEVFLLFDDFMFTLKDEIQNRRKIRRSLPESTAIEILYRLAKAERDLQKVNLRMGHINCESIMVNQDGDWRIISQYSCPNSLLTTISQQHQPASLLSPEELQNKNNIPHLNIQKQCKSNDKTHTNSTKTELNNSQIFTIGMIILQICTLQASQQIYRNGFNIGLLQERIKNVESKYSVSFVNIVKAMLELVPNQRIKHSQIINIFEPYEKQILAHQQICFQFNPFAQASTNANVSTINTSTKTTSNNFQKQNKNPNKWKRFTNFFPFLQQQTKNSQEMNHRNIHRTSSCFSQRKSITVASAH